MIRDLLRRAFVENAAIKGVAFVLAVTLFILVRGDKEAERHVRVGVAYVPLEGRVLTSEVPEAIDVWVRGSWTRIKRLDPSQIPPVAIDLNKAFDGEIAIKDTMIQLPAGLKVASIKPNKFEVRFQHEKKVPVVPEPTGSPPDGYAVERIVPNPAAVTIRGPKAIIEQISDLRTAPVSVLGKKTTFHQSVGIAGLPKGLTAEVDTVDVEVQIIEETDSRTLAVVPVRLLVPGATTRVPGWAGMELAPHTVEIVLRGKQAAMKQVEPPAIEAFVELQPGDFSPGKIRRAIVNVTGHPAGVAVEVRPREVTLTTSAPVPAPSSQPGK